MATVLMSSSVAALKMRMAISPLLAAMSFLIWRLGARASVLLVVAHRRRRRVERIILPLLESPLLFQLCSTPAAARDAVSAARKLRPVPVAAPVHSQRPRMPVRVATSASSTILALAAVAGAFRRNGPELGLLRRSAERGRGATCGNQHSKGLVYPSYDVQPRSARLGAHNAVRGVEDVPRRRRLVADCILEYAIIEREVLAADLDLGEERQRLHA